MTAVDDYTFNEYLHDPHSLLDIGDPDSEVYVVVRSTVLIEDGEMPQIVIESVKVYPELDSEDWQAPTDDQLAFWDLELRIVEAYTKAEEACLQCGCKMRHHLEIEADVYKCVVKDCDCEGERQDLEM